MEKQKSVNETKSKVSEIIYLLKHCDGDKQGLQCNIQNLWTS